MAQYRILWSIKELTKVLRHRQLNEFDCNFGVSGKRGDGKSTLLLKIFKSFRKEGFNQKEHQVYSQKDVMKLLANQKFSFCWDDEAINSGYKRDFQQAGQKILIKIITNYRDNYNMYGSALPFFYSLDKDLRELMFMHIHIIERGLAVILLPLSDQIHSSDPWDSKNNIKIEDKEYKRLQKNPNSKFRYQKFSTFAGYLYFGPMGKKEKEIYKKIKHEKRSRNFGDSGILDPEVLPFKERIFKLLVEKKLTKSGLLQACLIEGEKFSTISNSLNMMLKDRGFQNKVLTDFLLNDLKREFHSTGETNISKIVPDFSS